MSDARWIQNANVKSGALSKDLGVPPEKRIPITLLSVIQRATIGDTVKNPTTVGDATILVTRQIKRRALLALTFKRICKNHTTKRC